MLARNEAADNLYLAFCRQAEERVRMLDQQAGPYSAQLASPKGVWVALITAPAHERIAAAHLVARGFGICLPETEVTEVRRGRKVERTRILIPGYLFVYVWGVDAHAPRLRATPGVIDFLRQEGDIRSIPWEVINELREIENRERPMLLPMQEVARPKKGRRWRRSRRPLEQVAEPEPIVAVHCWSPFIEELRDAGLDDEARIAAFNRRLGLGS